MVVVGVDFSGKFPDAPPCYCVAVRDGWVFLFISLSFLFTMISSVENNV